MLNLYQIKHESVHAALCYLYRLEDFLATITFTWLLSSMDHFMLLMLPKELVELSCKN